MTFCYMQPFIMEEQDQEEEEAIADEDEGEEARGSALKFPEPASLIEGAEAVGTVAVAVEEDVVNPDAYTVKSAPTEEDMKEAIRDIIADEPLACSPHVLLPSLLGDEVVEAAGSATAKGEEIVELRAEATIANVHAGVHEVNYAAELVETVADTAATAVVETDADSGGSEKLQ
ncbi:hypothetical protein CEUSTIGMA_g2124.t1 [Chlamydomonas eustigma]|uniref:Uncharacterized protein n=1 Tax=Chlamydomonas eustigma TaxID=1157962 RepID=A0A250WV91_9CHLO|nr:hypothetical protein CEUSTIGMA_g2124.t1 [Chlamydomonas eustigma]|eukprot:GAX74676.1 hypothetical protein CEUSTIGMA_g2124.t1 [Chlamydomonas eustigma]